MIDCAGEPQLFKGVAEPWQWLLISRIIPGLEAVAGLRKEYNGPRSFWFTLPRGHDKTSLIGRLCGWCLAFSRRPLRMVAAAADKDQAGFILEFMQAEARLNSWFKDLLHFASWRVDGVQNGSRLRVLSADDKSSFGLKEDIMVLDELTHWPKRGLWDTIISGREKRPGSLLFVITNAGLHNTWQREVFEAAQKSSDWYVYEAPGQLASWMSKGKIDDLRKTLPVPLSRRMFDNVWTSESEECGFVTREEAKACVNSNLAKREKGNPAFRYAMSIDYAPVRDRTVMCVGHEEEGKVILDRMDILQGSPSARVQIATVERWIDEQRQVFFNPMLVADPYQMESTFQKYEGTLECVRFEARGGKANYELANNLRTLIINQRIEWYAGAGEMLVGEKLDDLVDELATVLIKVMGYGYRISHESNKHDDRVVALGQLALELIKNSGFVAIPTDSRWF